MRGTLFVVATPIGNLEDVTHRAIRVLGTADVIAAEDTRRTATLLDRYDIHTPTTSFHEHNEHQRLPALLARLAGGGKVALVSDAGTPGISDPGFRLIRAAVEQEARIEVIPGPSAVLAALVASGFPTSSFSFLGFPPVRSLARRTWLKQLAAEPRTTVFFEAPHRIRRTLEELREQIVDRPVAIARELTKVHEEVLRGSVPDVLDRLSHPRGEITVVVAPAPEPAVIPDAVPSDLQLWTEFCQLTEGERLNRRDAVGGLARTHRLSARTVYSSIERAKKEQRPAPRPTES
jgi:16S rRNA (cytidine1402-2'-O)-methyltransferase